MGKEVDYGVMSPRFYGLAYNDPCRRVSVCYPIPLNVIVRIWRNVVWAFKRGLVKDEMSEDWYRGYGKGYWDGSEDVNKIR